MHLGSFKFEGQLVALQYFWLAPNLLENEILVAIDLHPPPSSDMRGVKGDLADAFIGLWYRISSTWTSRQGIIR